MKVAVTAKGRQINNEVDPRFGRAPYILIVDTVTKSLEAIDNTENVNAFKGAGIKAATMISEMGAEVLLTGYCGPNAFKIVEAADIKVVSDVTGTVEQAVLAFIAGQVEYSTGANAEAHW